jgi:hypothetical protein
MCISRPFCDAVYRFLSFKSNITFHIPHTTPKIRNFVSIQNSAITPNLTHSPCLHSKVCTISPHPLNTPSLIVHELDSISSTPAGPSSAPTPRSNVPSIAVQDTLHAASAALTSQGLELCPHCYREMKHCNERFEFA